MVTEETPFGTIETISMVPNDVNTLGTIGHHRNHFYGANGA